jgi:hypothetical protein
LLAKPIARHFGSIGQPLAILQTRATPSFDRMPAAAASSNRTVWVRLAKIHFFEMIHLRLSAMYWINDSGARSSRSWCRVSRAAVCLAGCRFSRDARAPLFLSDLA